ncbi:MAG: PEP/pyruvate-binding domain-containing protein, partial [Bacteroidota bacterium]
MKHTYINQFKELSNDQVALVGGKNASLGEMFNRLSPKGIKIPDGFSTTAEAYWLFLDENNIREKLTILMNK